MGPTLRYGGNRTGDVGDDVVEKLGKLKSGFEGGVSFGVRYRRILHPYDSLSLGGSVRWDLSGRHGGATYGASLSYTSPLSKAQILGLQIAASFADDDYADYNYSVTPAGSLASGLPVYKAKGGLKELNVGAFTARDLSGDFRDGGFALGVGALYGRLQGSAAETPITSIRGTADQWIVGGGIAYSF
jgi:outer membrane scaffolding protein for murein synthesis (MipA/OmpV family)